jgi:Carboxypeptidase regulatory-like domain/Calx-beta domain
MFKQAFFNTLYALSIILLSGVFITLDAQSCPIAESEPNNTFANADVSPVQITYNTNIAGSITPVGDMDRFRVTVPTTQIVKFETFDSTGTACAVIDTFIRVYNSAGTQIGIDDDGGINSCSLLNISLAAGTHYLQVEQFNSISIINGYILTTSNLALPPPDPGTVMFNALPTRVDEGNLVTINASRVCGKSGAISVDYATSNGSATAGICGIGDYEAASGTLSWSNNDDANKSFTLQICPDSIPDSNETFVLTLLNPIGTSIIGINPATLIINEKLNGTINVGSGGDFPSLTNSGGFFETLNISGASGPISVNIISDLTGETGTYAINPIAGNHPVLIKPIGGPRTISGVAPVAVVRLNGADNITIYGYDPPLTVVGGNPSIRQLTIQNLSTSTSSGVITLHSNTDGANNNIIRNVNVLGNDSTQTLAGISSGGATIGSLPTVANNNNRIENCSVQKTIFGISSLGVSTVISNVGTVITQNDITGTGNNRVGRIGIQIQNENSVQVTENSIGGIDSSISLDAIGIAAGTVSVSATNTTVGNVTNAVINRNKINGITQSNTFSAVGIAVSGGANNTISNNMITGVIGDGSSGDLTAGIYIVGAAGSTTKLYYNSVSMTGDRSSVPTPSTTMFPSYGVAITGTNPIVELKNNIFSTTQTASTGGANATSYAIGMASATFSNLNSNYNAFYSAGANSGGFRTGSLVGASTVTTEVDYPIVTAWRTAVSDDPNSVEGNPSFSNPASDLHIVATNVLLVDKGTSVSALDDFDGQIRSLTGFVGGTPDIGADEALSPTAATATINGRVTTADGRSIRNVALWLTDTTTGEIKFTKTNPFGYYRFIDLEVGRSYVLSVSSKRFRFANPSRLITLDEDLTGEDFISEEK